MKVFLLRDNAKSSILKLLRGEPGVDANSRTFLMAEDAAAPLVGEYSLV